jgi:hypothetical protein
MDRRLLLAAARVLLAVLTGVAIVAQLAQSSDAGTLVPLNFASYFTIQSNVIGVVVFLVGAARWRGPSTPGWDLVRGASALNLTVTYVVFALLLSNTDVDVALPWVNTVVHTVFPLAVIADWLIDPPAAPISWARGLRWLAYPLLWLGYTMVRGAIADWYPYPFLDPSDGGYGTVALYVVAILVFGLVVVAVLRFAGNALQGRRLIPAATGTSAG